MHAQDVLGFDKSQVNLLFSAGPVVAMTVSLVVGSFIGKMGAALILLVGVAGFGPVLALWLGAGDFASAMVIFTAAYVFLQVATIAYDTLRAELVEGQGRGLALGILGAMTGTVAALGPPFASWLRERTHPMVPFWLTFAALGLMVVLLASHELPRLAGRRRVRPASSAGAS
jgi:MFS family permease